MLKGLKWLFRTLTGLAILLVALLIISRNLPIPTDEAAALESMAIQPASWQHPEHNAFPAVWLLPYEGVAPSDRPSLLAEDLARQKKGMAATPAEPVMESIAAERYTRIERGVPRWCGRDVPSCLAQVREHADEVADAHKGHDALHARIAALVQYTHMRSPFVQDLSMPYPEFGLLLDRTSSLALAHVRGESAVALQGVCEDATAARVLMRDGDNLITALIGAGWAERSANLFTEMLAELPATTAVPAQCRIAFVPPEVEELDLCQPLRGEFAFQASGLRPELLPLHQRWQFNTRKTQARTAWLLSRSCAEPVRAQIEAGQPVRLPEPRPAWTLDCADNLAGCVLMGIQSPNYEEYIHRMQRSGVALEKAYGTMADRR
jgi:hypothetical protein